MTGEDVRQGFEAVLPHEETERLCVQLGVIERQRKLDLGMLVRAMVISTGTPGGLYQADVLRSYLECEVPRVARSAFYRWFDAPLERFMATLPKQALAYARAQQVDLLGRVGLIYVMFLAGLEIDLEIVRAHPSEAAMFGLLAFACSLAPTLGVGLWMGYSLLAAVLLGALLSSHTLLAYPIIARLGLFRRQAVVTAIGGTLVTDTLALMALVIAIQVAGAGESGDSGALGWLVPLALLAGLLAVSLWGVPWLSRRVFGSDRITRTEKALFVLVVLLALAAAAELIGTKDILGAVLAGLCLNRALFEKEELREHVDFVGRMLFIPFFFISTGMLLELEIFTGAADVWLLGGIMLTMAESGNLSDSVAWEEG